MTPFQEFLKRSFDFCAAFLGLLLLWPVILVTWIIAARDTGASGFFRQVRVGRNGKTFRILKLRTMKVNAGTHVTVANDARITQWGKRFRNWKLDELPQLWNVLWGEMSLVGPRPDVPGYMDKVGPEWDEVRRLRPGITGPATLHYRNEEQLLAGQADPVGYNDTVIWPHKLQLNRDYARNWSLATDLALIKKTVIK